MNRFLLLLLGCVLPLVGSTQPSNTDVISSQAFTKLIKRDIRYAILGEQSAAPGVKLDFGKENSATITGPIKTNKGILTFSIQGGFQNGLLSMLNEGRFVEGLAGFNFHFIANNNARGVSDINGPIARRLITVETANLGRMADSLAVLGCLVKCHRDSLWQSLKGWRCTWYGPLMCRTDIRAIYKKWEVEQPESCLDATHYRNIVVYYLERYFNYKLPVGSAPSTADVPGLPDKEADLVLDLQALAERVAKIDDLRHELEIAISEKQQAYTSKKYTWITFSVAGGGKKVSYFHQLDSLETSVTRFIPVATIWYNRYRSGQKYYCLLRAGPAIRMDFVPTNTAVVSYTSTSTLGKGEKQTIRKFSEGEQLYFDKIHHTARLELALESYLITKSQSAFGLFGQVRYRYTPLLNYSEMQVDAGPTFNVPSPLKERSILTLLLYASLNNVLPAYQNPLQREDHIPLYKQWSAGVRVGIPINIIKESN